MSNTLERLVYEESAAVLSPQEVVRLEECLEASPVIIDSGFSQLAFRYFLSRHGKIVGELLNHFRDRFNGINIILEKANVNKHDLEHQLRVAALVYAFGVALRGSLTSSDSSPFADEFLDPVTIAATVHDVGYEGDPFKPLNKDSFSQHPQIGAEIFQNLINGRNGFHDYFQRFSREAQQAAIDGIAYHSLFSKQADGQVLPVALLPRLGDKSDNNKHRVFQAHCKPDSCRSDPRGCHRRLPSSVQDVSQQLHSDHLHMVYEVNLFSPIDPNYSPEKFLSDFWSAEGNSVVVISDVVRRCFAAIGVNIPNEQFCLSVDLRVIHPNRVSKGKKQRGSSQLLTVYQPIKR